MTLSPTQIWLVLGIVAYSALYMVLYGPRRGDIIPGREPRFEGDEGDLSRYTDQGRARMRRGRWMRWLALPYILVLLQLSGFFDSSR
jgi:hypothetical protein